MMSSRYLDRQAVIDAIESAQGRWTFADWAHDDPAVDCCCEDDTDGHDCPGACRSCGNCMSEGPHEGCETCERAEHHAIVAEEYGQEALALLQNDADIEAIVHALGSAALAEQEFGDDPVWGPAYRLAKALRSQILEGNQEGTTIISS